MAFTLDAGALIAIDRFDTKMWALLNRARAGEVEIRIPAGALAQAWRGSTSANLAHALSVCEIDPLDETAAKAAGALCAESNTSDIVDASVALSSHTHRAATIITTDPVDLRRLAHVAQGIGPIADLNDL